MLATLFLRVYPNQRIKNTIPPSEKAKNIQEPTPCTLEKSGIPMRVKALNKVAEKVIKPKIKPNFEPAMIKSSFDCTFLCEYQDKNMRIPK
jgi:hypothetical protein